MVPSSGNNGMYFSINVSFFVEGAYILVGSVCNVVGYFPSKLHFLIGAYVLFRVCMQ